MKYVYYGVICAASKICHLTYGRKQNDVIKKTLAHVRKYEF